MIGEFTDHLMPLNGERVNETQLQLELTVAIFVSGLPSIFIAATSVPQHVSDVLSHVNTG
jgi:hypothetical protein